MTAGQPGAPLPPRDHADDRKAAWSWLGLFALIGLVHGDAALIRNEAVYLVPSMRVVDPTLLAHDPWHGESPYRSTSVLFHVLAAPLWWLSDDPLRVAWMARAISWVWVLAGLHGLSRALGLPARLATLGIALYVLTSPGVAAREWIIKSGEQKVWAWGAVFFAIAAMLRGRTLAGGAWIGLATAFHVLVGGWSAIALGVASLADRARLGGLAALLRAGLVAAVIAAPVLVVGLAYLQAPVPTLPPGEPPLPTTQQLILDQLPYHLVPEYFLDAPKVVEVVAIFAAGLWLAASATPPRAARLLTVHLAVIVSLFASGLLASAFGWRGWLVYYPFRVADSMLPVVFWLLTPATLAAGWRARHTLTRPARRALIALAIVATAYLVAELPRHGARHIARTLASWSAEGRAAREDRLAIHHAMRAALPEDAIVAAYPCEEEIHIHARRGVVAARNVLVSNDRIQEWAARIRALQGGEPVTTLHWDLCQRYRADFGARPPDFFAGLRDRWGATHALIDGAHPHLDPYVILRERDRAVIRLDTIEAPAPRPSEPPRDDSTAGAAAPPGPPGP